MINTPETTRAGASPPSTGPGYAGDISVEEAWALLKSERNALLVDCRSAAEWTFAGVPDLAPLSKSAIFVELQSFPGMSPNPRFLPDTAAALEKAGAETETPVLCICRSGARSRTAAMALTRAGFARCYNVAGGVEGDLDSEGHRGRLNGWKAAGLPWRQT